MTFFVIVFGWLSFFSVALYLLMLLRLVSKFKRMEKEYWRSIGEPRLFDSSGQAIIMKKIVFGREIPESIWRPYGKEVIVIRWLFAFSALGFFVIFSMAIFESLRL